MAHQRGDGQNPQDQDDRKNDGCHSHSIARRDIKIPYEFSGRIAAICPVYFSATIIVSIFNAQRRENSRLGSRVNSPVSAAIQKDHAMKPLSRLAPANLDRHANVGADYDRAGERYRAYADGNLEELYHFEGQYGFGDREIWGRIEMAMHELRVRGVRELSVVDLGCGPGTWLRRIIDRARQMGFTRISARGIDLAEAQVRRARILSHGLVSHGDITLRFEVGDIRSRMPEADASVDICLCLYGVLNHLPAEDLPALFREVGRVTKGMFFTTVRAIGSTPTVYVDGVKAAKTYHQDNARGRLDIEFQDGSHTSFPSHLFSAGEIRALAAPALRIDELMGLDLFHGRFANDPEWNPAEAAPGTGFLSALRALERRYSHDPIFIDHATHLLMVARAVGR
jgi:SAM-dependent methyltransferase